MLGLRTMSRTYKNVGKSFYKMWANTFHNYTTILVLLFGKEAPDLYFTLAKFYSNIYKLSIIYKWQDAVLSMAIETHTFIVSQQPTNLSKWAIPEKFKGRFCTPKTMIRTRSIIRTCYKRKRLKSPAGRHVKSLGGSKNPSVICELFNKGSCDWPLRNNTHKCRECGSKEHGLLGFTAKMKKKAWQLEGMRVAEEVKIVEVASFANKTNLYQFIRTFSCFFDSPRANTSIKFELVDASKTPLINSPSSPKLSALADLFSQYQRGLKIHLPMIFCFGAELGYESPSNAFILSNNLASALKVPAIVEKKLQKHLASGRVMQVQESLTLPFICLPLGLVFKQDESWRRIHH